MEDGAEGRPLAGSDRFVPRAVPGEMVVIRGAVRSPQRMLAFSADRRAASPTASTTDAEAEATAGPALSSSARREAWSTADIARDTPRAEAAALAALAEPGDGAAANSSSARRRALAQPQETRRAVARTAFQVLAAPGMPDDFYVTPLDWGATNRVAVALRSGVHVWDANTAASHRLTNDDDDDGRSSRSSRRDSHVCSVAWRRGVHTEQLAEGLQSGVLRVRDAETGAVVAAQRVHRRRIGVCAWCPRGVLVATGSKDHAIGLVDVRAAPAATAAAAAPAAAASPTLAEAHRQEVCGLRWDPDGVLLASGGNDNRLVLWDHRVLARPLAALDGHRAAVKALAWSPHARGLLVSGGGTADRRLRFWDARTLACLGAVDTGSQVCNAAWAAGVDELATTHGFSQNQIVVWDTAAVTAAVHSQAVRAPDTSTPPAAPVATLRGHRARVLHLAVSPDGRTLVTGAGGCDQTLRFWRVFPGMRESAWGSGSSSSSRGGGGDDDDRGRDDAVLRGTLGCSMRLR